ncbi:MULTISPECIES: hypothetical protein [unclassified Azospirillum]|uniref:FitA-like ribbon-helix-helix domain-containing protein n=1 Tax=unclassified Azospirillum TaxID=2630922 RepID=UPI000B62E701|nr:MULTISPECIES: hypothetical protein [unclassified Azospirillum]SNS30035.1 hypothetical protein SAMN05880556_103381 [Azospirillum sp. RU38E]SNS48462.1 hypothetical protein SAMN05880591_103381 [Azospirillum sp. RU37A]
MVKALALRGIEDEVHEALRRRAAQSGRSIEAEARAIIAEACLPMRPIDWATGLRSRAKARTGDIPQTDSADLVREARDGRC